MNSNTLGSFIANAQQQVQNSNQIGDGLDKRGPAVKMGAFQFGTDQSAMTQKEADLNQLAVLGNLEMEQPNWYEVRSKTKAPDRRAYHASFVWEHFLYIYGGEDSHEGIRQTMYYLDLDFIGETQGKFGDPNTDPQWVPVSLDLRYRQTPGALAHHTIVEHNGFAYLMGGLRPSGDLNETLYKFEIQFSKWSIAKQSDELPGPRDDHTAVVHKDGMYVFGGYSAGVKTNSVYRYDLQSCRWMRICEGDEASGKAPSARSGHSASVWAGKMVVFGGIDHQLTRLNDTWIFDLSSNEWQQVKIKISEFYQPRVRSGHSAAIYNANYLVIFGGMTAVTKELDDVCALDLNTFEWHLVIEPKQTKSPEKSPNPLLNKLMKGMKRNIMPLALVKSQSGREDLSATKNESNSLRRQSTSKNNLKRRDTGHGIKLQHQTTLGQTAMSLTQAFAENSSPSHKLNSAHQGFSETDVMKKSLSVRKTQQNSAHFTQNPDVPDRLVSPTSDRMKNSFIMVNGATRNLELFRKSQANRRAQTMRNGGDQNGSPLRQSQHGAGGIQDRVLNNQIYQDKRPSARDGHTGVIISNKNEENFLFVFGGDRHGMPFNDLHVLDLKQEFCRARLN